jgi:flagellar biosynthesis/type III secretory pathway protein FliH
MGDYEEGYDEGYEDGMDEGKKEGEFEGREEAINKTLGTLREFAQYVIDAHAITFAHATALSLVKEFVAEITNKNGGNTDAVNS